MFTLCYNRPQFLTLYMNEPDYTGHGYGPDSIEVSEMFYSYIGKYSKRSVT